MVKMTARLKVKGTLFSLVDLGTQCSCFQVVFVKVSEAVHLNVFLQSSSGSAGRGLIIVLIQHLGKEKWKKM